MVASGDFTKIHDDPDAPDSKEAESSYVRRQVNLTHFVQCPKMAKQRSNIGGEIDQELLVDGSAWGEGSEAGSSSRGGSGGEGALDVVMERLDAMRTDLLQLKLDRDRLEDELRAEAAGKHRAAHDYKLAQTIKAEEDRIWALRADRLRALRKETERMMRERDTLRDKIKGELKAKNRVVRALKLSRASLEEEAKTREKLLQELEAAEAKAAEVTRQRDEAAAALEQTIRDKDHALATYREVTEEMEEERRLMSENAEEMRTLLKHLELVTTDRSRLVQLCRKERKVCLDLQTAAERTQESVEGDRNLWMKSVNTIALMIHTRLDKTRTRRAATPGSPDDPNSEKLSDVATDAGSTRTGDDDGAESELEHALADLHSLSSGVSAMMHTVDAHVATAPAAVRRKPAPRRVPAPRVSASIPRTTISR